MFLHYCCYGEFEKLAALSQQQDLDINCQDGDGCTGLHLAIGEKYREIVNFLVQNNADFYIHDNDGYSALHWAILSGETYFLDLVYQRNKELEKPDNDHNLPIHLCVIHQELRSLEWLLEKNININAQDKDGYTALHIAATSNLVDYGKVLLEAKAKTSIVNNRGETPLETAIRTENFEFAHLLKSYRNTNISSTQFFLSKEQFEKALRLGLGRAYLHVREHGDDGLQDTILNYCLNDPRYDQQCEDNRAAWFLSVVDLCADPEFYYQKIIQALLDQESDDNLSQLYALCLMLAQRGNKQAEQAIYEKFDRQEFNEGFFGGDHIIELHGLDGLTHVARILGQRMLADEEYWCSSTYPTACELLRKDVVDNHLAGLANEEPAIAKYLQSSQEIYDAWNKPRNEDNDDHRKRTRAELPLDKILKFIEEGTSHPSRCLRFGRHATEDEINIIFDKILNEGRDDQLYRALWVFRRRALPRLDSKIFDLAKSDNEKLRTAAIIALMHTSHASIRDLAIEIHNMKGAVHFADALELFRNNYQSGDHTYIEKALIETDDMNLVHTVGLNVLDIFGKHPKAELLKCMLWVYENTQCAHCRNSVVELLNEAKILPDTVRDECLFDSYLDTREIAKKAQTCS